MHQADCEFHPWQFENRLQKLRSLYLWCLIFTQDSGRLDRWLELAALEVISVSDCRNVSTFFQDLAVSIASHPALSLKDVSVVAISDKAWVNSFKSFLEFVPSVEHLYAAAPNRGSLDLGSLVCQGTTLRSVLIDPYKSFIHNSHILVDLYDIGELDLFVDKCPGLEQVGLCLSPDFFIEWPRNEPFVWSASDQSEKEEKFARTLVRLVIR